MLTLLCHYHHCASSTFLPSQAGIYPSSTLSPFLPHLVPDHLHSTFSLWIWMLWVPCVSSASLVLLWLAGFPLRWVLKVHPCWNMGQNFLWFCVVFKHLWCCCCFFLFFWGEGAWWITIYLRGREGDNKHQIDTQSSHPVIHSPSANTCNSWGAKPVRSQTLSVGLPQGWQGPSDLSHYCCLPRCQRPVWNQALCTTPYSVF